MSAIRFTGLGWLLAVVCASLFAGCASPGFLEYTGPLVGEVGSPSPDSPQGLAASAQRYAQRVESAEQQQPTPDTPAPQRSSQVRWLEDASPITGTNAARPAAAGAVRGPAGAPAAGEVPAAADAEPLPIGLTVSDASAAPTSRLASTSPTHRQLLGQILDQLRQSNEPTINKALSAAALSAADPYHELDWSFLKALGPRQQEAVERYHQLMVQAYEQIASDGGVLNRAALAQRFDELFGALPITIERVEICRRVDGFGIYTPFDSTTFLAGQNHKMIVYVEVDNFQPTTTANDEFEVRLTKEIVLYDEDGLAVWSHEPVQIVDRSRNHRRDFFTVQLITLPARLTVGKFHLKIRLIEPSTGNRDEKTIPLQIVADPALLKKRAKAVRQKP